MENEFDRYISRLKKRLNILLIEEYLSGLEFYFMPDGSSVNCAHVNMACKKKLNGSNSENGEITFICDEEDIDFWIGHLEEMKQKIRECKNGDIAKQIK